MTFHKLLIVFFISFPFPCVSDDDSADLKFTKSILSAYFKDPNFRCERTSTPSIVSFGEFTAAVGSFNCKYIPDPKNPKSDLPLEDHFSNIGCKLTNDGSIPSLRICADSTQNELPGTVQSGIGLLPKALLQGERSRKFGHCKYTTKYGTAASLVGIYAENDYEVVCATPINCTGGTEVLSVTVAACEPSATEWRDVKGSNGEVTRLKFPVCPGPATCLEKSLKVELAPETEEEKRLSKATPHRKSTDLKSESVTHGQRR